MSHRPPISETELLVLKVLWKSGPSTVRDLEPLLRKEGRRWAYNTILTLLQRLQAKGHVTSDRSAAAHVFRAAVSRDALLRRRLKDLAADVCEGTATPLVRALVDSHRFSREEIDELRDLVDRLEPKRGGDSRKGRS